MAAQISSFVAMSPEQQHQLLIGIVASDTDVKESRAAGTPVMKAGDLTAAEKMALVDLARMVVTIWKKALPFQAEVAECYQLLLRRVFDSWTSKDNTVGSPTLPPRKFPSTVAQVGVLLTDPTDEADLAAPAFLDVMLPSEFESVYGEGPWDEAIWDDTLWGGDDSCPPTWAYLWRDQYGHPLKREFVEFAHGVTKNNAKARAIAEYDRNEMLRIITYNLELIVNAARRRICKWAVDGTEAAPRVDEDDRLEQSDIERLELAKDYLEEHSRMTNYLTANARRPPPISFSQ